MARFEWPQNKKQALQVLNRFTEYAHAIKYKDVFQEAVRINHGAEFSIATDLSNRMMFCCQICNKDMNSLKALIEHANSGVHLKNADSRPYLNDDFKSHSTLAKCNYKKNTIQYCISNSSQKVLGLQFIEVYTINYSNYYYKCIQCGAHGRMEAMYNHVTGTRHTDKYIKFNVELRMPLISSEERESLRERLYQMDGRCDLSLIRTIEGREYFPFMWEADGKSNGKNKKRSHHKSSRDSPRSSRRDPFPRDSPKSSSSKDSPKSFKESPRYPSSKDGINSKELSKHFKCKEEMDNKPPPSSSSRYKRSNKKEEVNKKEEEDDPIDELAVMDLDIHFKNPSPPDRTLIIQEPDHRTMDRPTQCYTEGAVDELCTGLNFIIKTSHIKDSDIICYDDEKLTLEMIFNIALLLYQTYHTKIKELEKKLGFQNAPKIQQLTKEKNILSNVMGKVLDLKSFCTVRWDQSATGEEILKKDG